MKTITVYYTDGQHEYNTTVEYNTLQEAIDAVKLELKNTEYTVLEDKTTEQFELDTMFD